MPDHFAADRLSRQDAERVTPKPVKVSEKPRDMLKFDLDNEE